MNNKCLDDMIKGWFVGSFSPTAYKTDNCEVAVKNYRTGDKEAAHYHKVATEITVIISGQVRMCDKIWGAGDILVLNPGEVTDFEALENSITVVVKVPSVLHDKYLLNSLFSNNS